MKYMDKKGTILIIATLVVVMLSAISATLMMQIQADTNYTQFTKNRLITDTILKGAVHESLKLLNVTDPRQGHIGLNPSTPWTPANDVGMDGIANTSDLGENDGFPTFAVPGVYGPGEPNVVGQSMHIGVQTLGSKIYGIHVADAADQSFQAFYAVYDEDLGANGRDDNGDGKTDLIPDNDFFEAAFHRFWALTYYGGEFRKMVVTVAATNATNPGQAVSETFFKAIYAGNSSEDPNYFLDMGGAGKNGDAVAGDVYVTGNIRLSNASFMWKTEKYTDDNGNGLFDFGEPFTDDNGQEAGFYNFGTEAFGTVNMRSTIGKDWQTKQPTIGGGGPYTDGAPEIGSPDFSTSLAAVTVDVGAEIAADPKTFNVQNATQVAGKTTNDPNNPAHIFTRANDDQLAELKDYYHDSYIDNGLPNYILGDTVVGFSQDSALQVNEAGNNQVYYIDGNLCVGSAPTHSFYFRPPPSTDHSVPIRLTFIVKGNIVINDNLMYRNTYSPNTSTAYTGDFNYNLPINAAGTSDGGTIPPSGSVNWNPFDDAFALIALKNENAPTNSGNITFADDASTLGYMDAIMYAENDFLSNYGQVSPNLTINGMMLAGNHVRLNQEFVNGEWRARPDSARNFYTINFDTRIRELLSDPSWLPGLPGGSNRNAPPPDPDPEDYVFDTILSSSTS